MKKKVCHQKCKGDSHEQSWNCHVQLEKDMGENKTLVLEVKFFKWGR